MLTDNDVVIESATIIYYGMPWYYTGSEVNLSCSRHIYTNACENLCAVCGESAEPVYEQVDLKLASREGVIYAYSSPYEKPAKAVYTISGDTSVHAVESMVNTVGELWYLLESGGWAKADDLCKVYSREELRPSVSVIRNDAGGVSVRVGCGAPEARLYISPDGGEPDIKGPSYEPGVVLYADEGFNFSVKAAYRGVYSATVRYTSAKVEALNVSEQDRLSKSRVYFGLYKDVEPNSWYYDNISAAYEYGLMNGYSIAEFGVGGSVTVAQTIAMCARLHSLYHDNDADFTQRQGESWSDAYMAYAIKEGLISAPPADPDRKVYRLEFVAALALALPRGALEPIVDVPDGSIMDMGDEYSYVSVVYQLYRAGVLRGSDELLFRPNDGVTRAEAAAVITRLALPELRGR